MGNSIDNIDSHKKRDVLLLRMFNKAGRVGLGEVISFHNFYESTKKLRRRRGKI